MEREKLLVIDQILDLLRNGEWHEVREIVDKTRLREFKVEVIANFLVEYDFLVFNKEEKKIKLSPQLQLFLKKIKDIER